MSTLVTFNGSTYSIPANGDSNWGSNVSSYLIAISTGTLQRSGGSFILTAELNFGTSYGLKSLYYKSTATNPSSAGVLKLGNNESIGWRNAGNTGDYILKVNASDVLQYDSKTFLFSGEIVNADISASAAIALSKLAGLTASKALVSDGSGIISASTVTSTELGYLSGVTSAIQTQLDGKQATGSYALTTGKLSQFASTTSAELAGVISDETGTGSLVFSNSPSFTTPSLGVATATSINSTTIPSSKTLVVTTDKLSVMAATSSSELAGIISDETGSGSLVFATSPSLTTPSLGVATATSINGTTIPSSVTLTKTSDKLSVFAATTSAELKGVISDETGSGSLVFGTSPSLTTPSLDIATLTGQSSTPASPSAGSYKTYVKTSTGKLTVLDSSGVEKSAGGVSAWATATPYVVGDLVTYGNRIYVCVTANTSSTYMETDIAAQKWVLESQQIVTRNTMTYGFDFECGDVAGWTTAKQTAALTNAFPSTVGTAGVALSSSTTGFSAATTGSVAVTSTNPLVGTYSLNFLTTSSGTTAGDMAISSVYNVPIADRGQVFQIKFPYKLTGDTNSLVNMSGTSSNTYAVAIYDVTNAQWIQPAGCFNFVTKSVAGNFTGTFQVPITMTQYQLVIYNPTATGATTATLELDDFYIGKQVTVSGPAMSDMTIFTPTISSASGSITNLSKTAAWRRNGQYLEMEVTGRFIGAAGTWGNLLISIPSGLTIDTNILCAGDTSNPSERQVGYGTCTDVGVQQYDCLVNYNTTNLVQMLVYDASATYARPSAITSTGPFAWGSSDTFQLRFSVPIVGWSSNSVQSADTDTRVIATSANANSTTSITGSAAVISLQNVTLDTNGAFSTSTNRLTCLVSGVYKMTFTGLINCTAFTTTGRVDGSIVVNGTNKGSSTSRVQSTGFYPMIPIHCEVAMVAGDYVEIKAQISEGTFTCNMHNDGNHVKFLAEKLSGPSVITATDSIIESYCDTAGGNITSSGNTVVFNTKIVSQTGSYNSSTGIFTAPVSGSYSAQWRVQTVAQSPSTSQSVYTTLQKNGSDYEFGTEMIGNGTSILPSSIGSTTVRLLSGETCNVKGVSSLTAALRSSSTASNYFHIVRIGNY